MNFNSNNKWQGFKKHRLRQVATYFKKKLVANKTLHEEIVFAALKRLKIQFDFQKPIICTDKIYIVDFIIHKHHIIVEIDGGHHSNSDIAKRDSYRTFKILNKLKNYKVIRISNNDIEYNLLNLNIDNYISSRINKVDIENALICSEVI